eukprot:6820177-Prymnesium_polylepis.1
MPSPDHPDADLGSGARRRRWPVPPVPTDPIRPQSRATRTGVVPSHAPTAARPTSLPARRGRSHEGRAGRARRRRRTSRRGRQSPGEAAP